MFKLITKPYQLFLVDSLGAFITAALTLLLTQFKQIGMPHKILMWLAGVALLYSIYSFTCYRFKPVNWRPYLKIIMLANVLYCCATITLLYYFYETVTAWDLAYFISEIGIVCGVVYLESKAVSQRNV